MLSFKPIHERFAKLPSSSGTGPVNLFKGKEITSSCEAFDNEIGMAPVNLFPPITSPLMLGNLTPMSPGRLPSRLLNASDTWVRLDRLKKLEGIVPVKLLPPIRRVCNLVNLPISSGMIPSSLASSKPRKVREEKFPMAGEIFSWKIVKAEV